jgi:hypothetical protein
MFPYASAKSSLIATAMKSRSTYPIFQWGRKLQVPGDEFMCSARRNAGTFAILSDGNAE